jgi:GDP-4-dehydro-6-deoxy-D-mannose reductase
MRVLVTGVAGFVGRHAARDLAAQGHAVCGFDRMPDRPDLPLASYVSGDIRDVHAVKRAVAETRPEACLHLAAMTFTPAGWEQPDVMFSVNVLGTIAVLQSLREAAPTARLVVVSSAHVYGSRPALESIGEDTPLQPDTVYAATKSAAEQIARICAQHGGLPVVTVRPSNHIGPGQSGDFVVASLARQLKAMPRDDPKPILEVGNLNSQRDFTDVRDVVRAYRLLMERPAKNPVYNIGSGRRVSIRQILNSLCELVDVHPQLVVDPKRYREADASPLLDTARIRNDVGWYPEIPLTVTLRDILHSS